jgi:hypothetical protein
LALTSSNFIPYPIMFSAKPGESNSP